MACKNEVFDNFVKDWEEKHGKMSLELRVMARKAFEVGKAHGIESVCY